eukprot:jgi/Bigna1/89969/estExt_fgenesh1_pg.C_590044
MTMTNVAMQLQNERLHAIVEKYKIMLGEEKRNEARLEREIERLRYKIEETSKAYQEALGNSTPPEGDRRPAKPVVANKEKKSNKESGHNDGNQEPSNAERKNDLRNSDECDLDIQDLTSSIKSQVSTQSAPPSVLSDGSELSSSATAIARRSSTSRGADGVGHKRMSSTFSLASFDSEDLGLPDKLPDIWIGYLDEKTECMYYFNPALNKTSWVEPDRTKSNILIHVDAVQQIKEASSEERLLRQLIGVYSTVDLVVLVWGCGCGNVFSGASERVQAQLDQLKTKGCQLLKQEHQRVCELENELQRLRGERSNLQKLVRNKLAEEVTLESELLKLNTPVKPRRRSSVPLKLATDALATR